MQRGEGITKMCINAQVCLQSHIYQSQHHFNEFADKVPQFFYFDFIVLLCFRYYNKDSHPTQNHSSTLKFSTLKNAHNALIHPETICYIMFGGGTPL